jgi:DNA primase
MDSVAEIKARLPIEDLVRSYTQLTKKGKNYVGLCPFHNDTHPSFLVSPDKGICYCFPCQKGGDIFSFYQQIEHVDFPQALRDLAERTGVTLPDAPKGGPTKDEKERIRDCLDAANSLYKKRLAGSPAKDYLDKRGVTPEEIATFELGVSPVGFTDTYDELLKAGYSRKEIVLSGLAIQKDLQADRPYDRFRNRLMFPIHDGQGRIIGFGGRTLGDDDAKYLNGAESPLYRKSAVLYGLHHALQAMRDAGRVIVVEGYFDVLACHRVGMKNVVATCGTALTEEHAKLLKRYVETVVLCLDSDKAGQAAAERAFPILSRADLIVEAATLGQKDPADAAQESPDMLKALLSEGRPYLQLVVDEIGASDLSSPSARREALGRLLPLLEAAPSATERAVWIERAAASMSTTVTAMQEDLQAFETVNRSKAAHAVAAPTLGAANPYTTLELALGLLMLYPAQRALVDELIAPESEPAAALFAAVKAAPVGKEMDFSSLPDDVQERARILLLFCEENGFAGWNDSTAAREIRRNCQNANREVLRKKLQDITREMMAARKSGKIADEELLRTQYQQVLKLAKIAG